MYQTEMDGSYENPFECCGLLWLQIDQRPDSIPIPKLYIPLRSHLCLALSDCQHCNLGAHPPFLEKSRNLKKEQPSPAMARASCVNSRGKKRSAVTSTHCDLQNG